MLVMIVGHGLSVGAYVETTGRYHILLLDKQAKIQHGHGLEHQPTGSLFCSRQT